MSNRKYKADFDYVKSHINEFFGRKSFGKSLALIDDIGITGWEKWWQLEFAIWLSDHDQISEWVMEEVFYTDLRKTTQKNSIAIDLGFRAKGCSKDEMIFLELKQNPVAEKCIANMLTDVEKVYSAQKYSVDNGLMIRSFFVVGVYLTPDEAGKADVHDYICDKCDEMDIPIERSHIFTKYIPDSPYSVTFF